MSEKKEDNSNAETPTEAGQPALPVRPTATLPPPYGTLPGLGPDPQPTRAARRNPTLVGIAPSPAKSQDEEKKSDPPSELRARAPLGTPSTPPPPPSDDLVTSFDYGAVSSPPPARVELPVDYAVDVPLPGSGGVHALAIAPTDPAPPMPEFRRVEAAVAPTGRPPEARVPRYGTFDSPKREPSMPISTEVSNDGAPEESSRRLGPALVASVFALLVISGWLLFDREAAPPNSPLPATESPQSTANPPTTTAEGEQAERPDSAESTRAAAEGAPAGATSRSPSSPSEAPALLPPVPARISALPTKAREERAGKLRKAARRTFRFKQYETSERLWRNALQYTPDDAASRSGLALSLDRQGKRDEALAWMRMAIEADPTVVDHFIYLGAMLEDSGDGEGARTAFEEALRLDPNDKRARHRLKRLEPAAAP